MYLCLISWFNEWTFREINVSEKAAEVASKSVQTNNYFTESIGIIVFIIDMF